MKWISMFMILTLHACSDTDIRTRQMLSNGRELYTSYCSNCHQANGEGIKGIIPPLKTDFIISNPSQLPCIIKQGMSGRITVNGITYNGVMPANKKLSRREVIFIANYVMNTFNHSAQLIDLDLNTDSLFSTCQ